MTDGLLLVHTNREVVPEVVLPIGLARVADSCDAAGIPVQTLDLAFVRDPKQALRRAIRRFRPAMIGLTVRNVDNADFQAPVYYLPAVAELVRIARTQTDAPIVAGGSGVSIAPGAVRNALGVDAVVGGPGEHPIRELWDRHRRGLHLPGLLMGDVGSPGPVPRYERWLDLKPYRRRGAPLPVQSRRGCPFGCIYCNYADIDGTARYALAELAGVVQGIAGGVAATGLKDVEFVDSTFNSPPAYTQRLCEALARADLGVRYRASGVNPRFANRATLEAMKDAGFVAVRCSPDTAAPELVDGGGSSSGSRSWPRSRPTRPRWSSPRCGRSCSAGRARRRRPSPSRSGSSRSTSTPTTR